MLSDRTLAGGTREHAGAKALAAVRQPESLTPRRLRRALYGTWGLAAFYARSRAE